jgi:hypothetical protein
MSFPLAFRIVTLVTSHLTNSPCMVCAPSALFQGRESAQTIGKQEIEKIKVRAIGMEQQDSSTKPHECLAVHG